MNGKWFTEPSLASYYLKSTLSWFEMIVSKRDWRLLDNVAPLISKVDQRENKIHNKGIDEKPGLSACHHCTDTDISCTLQSWNIYKSFLCFNCGDKLYMGFPGGSAGKESARNAGDLGLIPRLGRSPGEGNGYPLQYSDLEKSMGSQRVGHDWVTFTSLHMIDLYLYHFFLLYSK